MRTIIKQNPVIAILRNVDSEILLPYVESILKGGIRAIEVAMNTPDGARQIERIKETFGEEICVGAGTAITTQRIQDARNAGAQFFLTPSIHEELLNYYKEEHLKLLPGVLTPSEVDLCLRYGFSVMKLFPAGDMPFRYVKSLKGPFQEADFVAVGGVSLDNMKEFFDNGYMGVGIAGALLPRNYLDSRDWQGAAQYISNFSKNAASFQAK